MAEGLICMFCEQDGFESQEQLEEHIESHPWVARKPEYDR